MSVVQYPDSISAPELQIWNNLAFDNGESEEPVAAVKASWSLMQFVNTSDSIESDLSKENLSPNRVESPVPVKQPLKLVNKKMWKEELGVLDERRIDSEIEEIENEISRLSSKLEALRMEKIVRTVKTTAERRGRVVPAKFMDQKSNVKNSEPQSKLKRRGFSVGPAEIAGRQVGKPEMTPVQSIQNRRKSCFWKLQEIDERKVQVPRQAVTTTVMSRKVSKKEDSVLASIQPKKLFGDKSGKKPAKMGRVVPSRYSQIQSNGSERKRSLPDDGNEEAKRSDKRLASLVGKSWGSEFRVKKKKWDITNPNPNENVTSVVKVVDVLPRIRTNRIVNETPRNSGAAKRVAELKGRRSVFSAEEEEEESVCQALNFGDDGEGNMRMGKE